VKLTPARESFRSLRNFSFPRTTRMNAKIQLKKVSRVYLHDSRANLFPIRAHSCSFVVYVRPHLTFDSRVENSPLVPRMKRYLPFVIVIGVALATFGSGAMLYRAKRPQVKNIPESQSVLAKNDTSAHVRGNPEAPVTLEEFGDFQCPPCGQFAAFVDELLKEYDSRLRVVFRNFPLPAHQHALEAAQAAEAAGLQGKFWEMYDTLYRQQLLWSDASNASEMFESYAGTIGLDVDQFKKDRDSDKVRERIDSDHALADSLGVKVTPTIFINNRPLESKDKNPEGVRAAINAALEEKSKNGT
jgi:protein-disulfide isomerase